VLAWGGDEHLTAWDVTAGRALDGPRIPAPRACYVALSRSLAATTTGNNRVALWDWRDARELRTLDAGTGDI
jgi:hypothetical protein